MKERRRNILIGLFVLGGLIALGSLILLFGSFPTLLSGSTYPVYALFSGEVEQVETEIDVLMLGKRIGWVSDVQYRHGDPAQGLQVTMRIFNDVEVPVTAVAALKEAALGFGRNRIQLQIPPGTAGAETLPKDAVPPPAIPGTVVGAFDQIIPKEMGATLQKAVADVGELAAALTPAARDLHELFKPTTAEAVDAEEARGNLSSAAERLDATLRSVNNVIGDEALQRDVRVTVANIRVASEQLQVALDDIQAFAAAARKVAVRAGDVTENLDEGIREVRQDIDRIAGKILIAADHLSAVLAHLNTAAERVSDGEGTIGSLVNDNRLYEALVLTAGRLNEAVQDLQALVKTWQVEGLRLQNLPLGTR